MSSFQVITALIIEDYTTQTINIGMRFNFIKNDLLNIHGLRSLFLFELKFHILTKKGWYKNEIILPITFDSTETLKNFPL